MSLKDLISGNYCPVTGLRIVDYKERIAPRCIHPPGHYATMSAHERTKKPVDQLKYKPRKTA